MSVRAHVPMRADWRRLAGGAGRLRRVILAPKLDAGRATGQKARDSFSAYVRRVRGAIEGAVDVAARRPGVGCLERRRAAHKRFGELLEALDGISPKMLGGHLRHLESFGVLAREAYAELSRRV